MIKPHKTWRIHDASKIQVYMDCARQYFYKHILGWVSEEKNHHLVFGEAIHDALEYMSIHGYDKFEEAHAVLTETYRTHLPDDTTDHLREPKTPAYALLTLAEYAKEYKDTDKDWDILYTEIAGTVPINDGDVLHFRMDKIIRNEEGVWGIEHKTGSRLGRQWLDQWTLSFQISLYTHVLYCLYDPKEVRGIKIDGIIMKKPTKAHQSEGRLTGNEYIRVPILKTPDMMEAWLWNANSWLLDVEWNIDRIMVGAAEEATNAPVMEAFPMNTQNCTKYFGCPYRTFCNIWPNPLQHCDAPPVGFVEKWWDPSDREKKAANVVTLGGK